MNCQALYMLKSLKIDRAKTSVTSSFWSIEHIFQQKKILRKLQLFLKPKDE